jgi:serine/threonine protein kinase
MIIAGRSDDSFTSIVCKNIGSGAFGKVLEAEYNSRSGKKFIVALKTASCSVGSTKLLENEKIVLSSLGHNNIIKYWGSFTHAGSLYLILDLAISKSLAGMIPKDGFCDHIVAGILKQVARGVIHCHNRLIIHRDIKPENILLDHNNVVKLADFGLSKIGTNATTICGTREFMAPEIFGKSSYGKKVDVWAIGVLHFELLCGELPFAYDIDGNTDYRIKSTLLCMSENACDVTTRLLRHNPDKRIELEALDSLPFFQLPADIGPLKF